MGLALDMHDTTRTRKNIYLTSVDRQISN
jgi:hypothetical protein